MRTAPTFTDERERAQQEDKYLREKREFFENLTLLDQESDHEQDTSDAARVLRNWHSRRQSSTGPAPTLTAGSKTAEPVQLRHVSVEPQRSANTMPPRASSNTKAKSAGTTSKKRARSPPSQRPAASVSKKAASKHNDTKWKKAAGKKDKNRKQIPESRQIFKGFVFMYVPNYRLGARKVKMERAEDYGATIVDRWTDGVTHIIVDKTYDFQNVKNLVRLEPFPTNVLVLDEAYPPECIDDHRLIDPKRRRFRVEGFEEPTSPKDADDLDMQRSVEDPTRSFSNPTDASPTSTPHTPAEARTLTGTPQDVEELNHTAAQTISVSEMDHSQDEDEAGLNEESSDYDTDDEEDKRKAKRRRINPSSEESWQKSFSSTSGPASQMVGENPNARTIEALQELATYYDNTKDQWRGFAYWKAISALKQQTVKIETKEQARAIPSIGNKLADKIVELVQTNKLRRLENIQNDPNGKTRQIFTQVYGAGSAVAQKWMAQGYKSLDDLRERAELTRTQKIGLEHYDDFLERIPRDEVEAHGSMVRKALLAVDNDFQATIGGSYRRGNPDSGDIDVLITRPGATIDQLRKQVQNVIDKLFRQGFLKEALATFSENHGSKWHGASALPGKPWRRIDLLLVPWDEYGAALIYFTGNDLFNRNLRKLAGRKDMRLNQHGLYKDVKRGPGRKKLNEGTLVEGYDEKRIFDVLGVPWSPPEERNV